MAKFVAKLRRRQLDGTLPKFRDINTPAVGYIREIRDAIEMSSYQLAERMGLSQSTAIQMEESERSGSITIRTLERAASALGCRLVYALVPETSLESMVNEQARKRATELAATIFRTMALEAQSTDTIDQNEVIEELKFEVLRKGKRELWKHEK